jgi:predicted DNA-binding transcriptional regulator AlpA
MTRHAAECQGSYAPILGQDPPPGGKHGTIVPECPAPVATDRVPGEIDILGPPTDDPGSARDGGRAALGRSKGEARPTDRLALRLDDIAAALGVSRRAIERERSAGRLPKPDRKIGRMPIWSPETIRRWIEGGGRR